MDVDDPSALCATMYLPIAQLKLRSADVMNDPRLASLAAEDAAWQFSFQDWREREPTVWRRPARRRWLADGWSLFEARNALRSLAAAQISATDRSVGPE